MPSHIDKEKAKKNIALVIDRIKTEVDPWLLDEYHSLFKREVSLFHRSKVAACLLMLYDQGKDIRFSERNAFTEKKSFRNTDSKKKEDGSTVDSMRYPLADEESKRLFFSVGRSRRVFPREILGLINTKTAIPKEDIGAIRILDNYSFVQVRDTVAERIIEALNGMNFRGRPLTVNYAKSRKDEENSTAENGSETYGDTDDAELNVEYTDPPVTDDSSFFEETSEQNRDHSEEEDI